MSCFLGLDIGTSSVKGVLVDERQRVVAQAAHALSISEPQPLWSEQDPESWTEGVESVVAAIRADAPEAWRGLVSIGLSGQMHGATLLDASDRPLRPSILWNDGRSGAECDRLNADPDFARLASNLAMPGFTAPKLMWVARREPETFATTRTVLLPKDYVRLRLTGEKVSDMSDAAGTLWLDIGARRWSDDLLERTDMRREQMPALVEGSAAAGQLTPDRAVAWGLAGRRVVVAGGGGDNACSAVGIGATRPGEGFLSLGTSGVLFAVTDALRARPERGLHAFCHALPGRWHGMAVMLSAASALAWVAALTGQADIGALPARVEAKAHDAGWRAAAPLFLPYLAGERTPHNDPGASGLFAGLRGSHSADALAFAVLEGVAFAFADGLDVLDEASARPDSCLLVGGGARSDLWAQLLADALRLPLERPARAEIGAALGAARLALLASGGSEAEVCVKPAIAARFEPGEPPDPARRARFRALYQAEKTTRM